MTPLEKAILWSIGIGNYNASDIYEEGNKKLKDMGASTRHYSEFKKKFYEFAKLPPEGKGLIEFTKRGKSFCYWLSKWGEIAFAEKLGIKEPELISFFKDIPSLPEKDKRAIINAYLKIKERRQKKKP